MIMHRKPAKVGRHVFRTKQPGMRPRVAREFCQAVTKFLDAVNISTHSLVKFLSKCRLHVCNWSELAGYLFFYLFVCLSVCLFVCLLVCFLCFIYMVS